MLRLVCSYYATASSGSIETGVAKMFFQHTVDNGSQLEIECMVPTATALEPQLWRLVHS